MLRTGTLCTMRDGSDHNREAVILAVLLLGISHDQANYRHHSVLQNTSNMHQCDSAERSSIRDAPFRADVRAVRLMHIFQSGTFDTYLPRSTITNLMRLCRGTGEASAKQLVVVNSYLNELVEHTS